MSAEFEALAVSGARLSEFVGRLVPDDLEVQAFPTEWTVADTLSHIGSGAVITLGRIDASVERGEQFTIEEIRPIWDAWNAKEPQQKAADALMADHEMIERLEMLTEAERARVAVAMGPTVMDYDATVRSRVSEHAVHFWDIRAAFDPTATLEQESAALVIDHLQGVVGWGGKTDGVQRSLSVRTTDPERGFVVTTDADGVGLTSTQPATDADVVLPAEAFIRLVYGRLPLELTPADVAGEAHLAELRTIFRGV